MGCERLVFSSDYLTALTQPNVEMVHSPARTGVNDCAGCEPSDATRGCGVVGFTAGELPLVRVKGDQLPHRCAVGEAVHRFVDVV